MHRTPRVLVAAAAAACTTLLLAACASGGESLADEPEGASTSVAQREDLPSGPVLDRIQNDGELVVGMPEDLKGFAFLDPISGEYTGFEADLASMLAEYLLGEASVRHVTVTADTRESLLQNGTVDVVLSTYQITEPRLEKIDFAGPHMELGTALISTPDWDGEIATADDLAGLKVITTAGAAADYLGTAAPDATPVVFDSLSACIQALKDGRGDVFLNNTAVAIGLVADDDELVLAGSFDAALFGIGTSKEDPAFTEVVNDFLEQIEADGQWEQAWDRNVGVITGEPAPTPPAVGTLFLD
ncbi:transporter substrate-binding domain-containing protein [Agromyces silvae]|uniref:transporter substrate-binding domain-containing protein n=1 Tax=Agromyces silvae TaxID=3388266 RepID=UPI00280AA038|nr:transporter substrate-binding domain-containing protein [Agromyces protaetiae]